MRKAILAGLIAVTSVPTSFVLAEPAAARDHRYDRYHNSRVYDNYGRYREPRPVGPNDRIWRGHDGHYYCKRDNGTTGLIIGGAVGALVGREIDGGHNRTIGTILGAAGGGLLGREIDRSGMKCR